MGTFLLGDIGELRRRLRPHLAPAIRAIAFGSVARGDADEWSDLDLLVVARTDRPFLERFKGFAGVYDVWPRLDLLVYTPQELQRMVEEENPFILEALREGVVVHEAGPG